MKRFVLLALAVASSAHFRSDAAESAKLADFRCVNHMYRNSSLTVSSPFGTVELSDSSPLGQEDLENHMAGHLKVGDALAFMHASVSVPLKYLKCSVTSTFVFSCEAQKIRGTLIGIGHFNDKTLEGDVRLRLPTELRSVSLQSVAEEDGSRIVVKAEVLADLGGKDTRFAWNTFFHLAKEGPSNCQEGIQY